MLPRSCSGHLYEVLELSDTCTTEDVKRTYRRLALRLHPDRTNGTTTAQFQQVEEAHRILSNPDQRQLYDTLGRDGMKKLGNYGVPNFLLSAKLLQCTIFSATFFFAMLLLTLILISMKLDSPQPSWSWPAVMAPLWVITPVFLLIGLACLSAGVKGRALEPALVGCEVLLCGVMPAVACAALTGRVTPPSRAFIPFVLLYASVTVRSLYGLLPAVYSARKREEDELWRRATGDTTNTADVSAPTSSSSSAPCRSRAYLVALVSELWELICVVAFICLCFARADQGPVAHFSSAATRVASGSSSDEAGNTTTYLSFWIVFSPLIIYFGVLTLIDSVLAFLGGGGGSSSGGNAAGSRFQDVAETPTVVSASSTVDEGGARVASTARPQSHRREDDEPYGSHNGATRYTRYSDHQPQHGGRGGGSSSLSPSYGTTTAAAGSVSATGNDSSPHSAASSTSSSVPLRLAGVHNQSHHSRNENSDEGGSTSAASCCSRLVNALVAPFYHVCFLYMVCMWAAKEEVDYNRKSADDVPFYPSVYAATFPVFIALVLAILLTCCISCAVKHLLKSAVAGDGGSGSGGGENDDENAAGHASGGGGGVATTAAATAAASGVYAAHGYAAPSLHTEVDPTVARKTNSQPAAPAVSGGRSSGGVGRTSLPRGASTVTQRIAAKTTEDID